MNEKINTSGGSYVQGNANTGGGDFIGRDLINVGNVSDTVAAINSGVQIIYHNIDRGLTKIEIDEQIETREYHLLGNAIKTYIEQLKSQADLAQKTVPTGNPYKPLLEYDIQDAALFFGRTEAIDGILSNLHRSRMMVLHAESGAGKTSLLKAGIRPRLLADGHVPLYIRPYQTPVHSFVKRALLPQIDRLSVLNSISMHDYLQAVTSFLGSKWLVIFVDQFEEFFLRQISDDQECFVDQLAKCLDNDLLPVRWIFSLKGEWFTQMGRFRPQIKNPFANDFFLKSFSRTEAVDVIVQPAKQRDTYYESQLVETILDDLGGKEIYPPPLQIVCSSLFENRDVNIGISQDIYEKLGETRGILLGHLDRVISREISVENRILAQRVLAALVSSDDQRLLRSRDELERELNAQGISIEKLDLVLNVLLSNHLLRYDEIFDGNKTYYAYELAHEYIVDKINLDQEARNRKFAQELLEQETRVFLHSNKKLTLDQDKIDFILPHIDNITLSRDAKLLLDSSRKKNRKRSIIRSSIVFPFSVMLGGLVLLLLRTLFVYITPSNYLTLFYFLIGGVAIIGFRRGWAKEMLITLGVILSMFLSFVLEAYVPIYSSLLESFETTSVFFIKSSLLILIVGFLNISPLITRKIYIKLVDRILGLLMGLINGYFIFGTLWAFLHELDYPYLSVLRPDVHTELGEMTLQFIELLPPYWLGTAPGIFVAVGLAFLFVLVVFV